MSSEGSTASKIIAIYQEFANTLPQVLLLYVFYYLPFHKFKGNSRKVKRNFLEGLKAGKQGNFEENYEGPTVEDYLRSNIYIENMSINC